MKSIKILNPNKLPVVSYKKLTDFQGNLKEVSQAGISQMINSIIENGVFVPAFVWIHNNVYFIIDGHTRKMAFNEIEKLGYKIPDIPYVEIEAKNRTDAKKKLLLINSKYGNITYDGLYEYIEMDKIDFNDVFKNIALPGIDMQKFADSFYNDVSGEEVEKSPGNVKVKYTCPECGFVWEK